jgi:NAD(P)-dependent dehydrogenase (short-subunit alcohol dehydrogenase family)
MTSHPPRIALVTGASSGIGAAAAERLVRAGFTVFGTSRHRAEQGARRDVEMLTLDVTEDASVEATVHEVIERAGRLDVLVNNAGLGLAGAAEESSMEQARALFDTNVLGAVRMTRAALPQMRRQGSGRIVNISSVVGFVPAPFMALYAATKHAIEGYSESLDHEVRTFGIRVLLVEPHYTRTQFDTNMPLPDAPLPAYEAARTAARARVQHAVSIGDDPEVVAEVVLTAVTSPKPRLRYTAGSRAGRLRMLRTFVPSAMFDTSLRKQMGLDPR